jgi:hypothetical protein
MGTLGPTPAFSPIVASAAASSQARRSTDAIAATEQNKLQADLNRAAHPSIEDIVETDASQQRISDREGDGRMPWQLPTPKREKDEEENAPTTGAKMPAARNRNDETGPGQVIDLTA